MTHVRRVAADRLQREHGVDGQAVVVEAVEVRVVDQAVGASWPADQVAPRPAGEAGAAAAAGPSRVRQPGGDDETARAEERSAVRARWVKDMVSFPLRQREGADDRAGPPAAFHDSVCSERVVAGVPARRTRSGEGAVTAYGCGSAPASDRLPPPRASLECDQRQHSAADGRARKRRIPRPTRHITDVLLALRSGCNPHQAQGSPADRRSRQHPHPVRTAAM